MKTITRNMQISIEPTPEDLAEVLWSMGSDQQATFFNHLNEISGARLCYQLQAAIELDRQGRRDVVSGTEVRALIANMAAFLVASGDPYAEPLIKHANALLAQPAEPVKVPSDDDFIREIIGTSQFAPAEHYANVEKRVRALLARYGQPAQPYWFTPQPAEPEETP